jgi:hydrogenase maturation protein HypF
MGDFAPMDRARLKACVRGAVQGVGFRPFVFRLATELGLNGWVNNSAQGVFLEVEGPHAKLEELLLRLETEKPPRSFIQSLEASWLDTLGYDGFEIRESDAGGAKTALVLPDIATCPDCLREIFDPANRRYRYPFTNCTNCGPRFSILEALPYDRANTSMKGFTMCAACRAEYDDPRDRRFHAQPNACPVCGPQLELWEGGSRAGRSSRVTGDRPNLAERVMQPRSPERGYNTTREHAALVAAAEAVRQGRIVAVKGLGGFHLVAAAHEEQAVRCLRERKQREEKPFALMFPSLECVKAVCEVAPLEERLLRAPEAPIVLLRQRDGFRISDLVAPGNPHLGVMLPYTPLHHLLMAELGCPVVATSGNLSDEPICTDEREALERLAGIADLFLVHNRPIVRHVDDSIVRVMMGRELVLRRARGYAPLPVELKGQRSTVKAQSQTVGPGGGGARASSPAAATNGAAVSDVPESFDDSSRLRARTPAVRAVLAVGAHLKNTVALAVGEQVFVSQHIGDLETPESLAAFRRVIADFERLYEAEPAVVVADLHPDYVSTRYAHQLVAGRCSHDGHGTRNTESARAGPEAGAPQLKFVQHHIAHVLACMAENELEPPVLGVAWDGTGYGPDGTVWGGEFFRVTESAPERVGWLRPFPLPGGERAVREPRRSALGVLFELFGEGVLARHELPTIKAFSEVERGTLGTMLSRKVNCPLTSSVGRLFDAVASLVGLRQVCRFEGHAAMELEFALAALDSDAAYQFQISDFKSHTRVDWEPMLIALLDDLHSARPPGEVSAKFHNGLAEAIVAVARRVGEPRVVLSGGCFQNRHLTERAVRRLQEAGFRPYWHQRIPPNDGGIALGQVVAVRWALG